MSMKGIAIWKHIKSGKHYIQMPYSILNATNGSEDQKMVMYYDDKERVFVREQSEFAQKFLYIGEMSYA